MAVLDMSRGLLDDGFWRERRVLVTGHTGFKGSWLSLWLQAMGAAVFGFSRGVPTDPSLYALARVSEAMSGEVTGDIRDAAAVARAVERVAPEIVLHLAAQPLVRRSFSDPRETFDTNVMGTVNVLDAVRTVAGVRVVIAVTSDKCYENRDWEWGYREDEAMGGHDPYSASKGAAELVISAYDRSFFSAPSGPALASARAGNVIGGGDWGEDRLMPDLMRAGLEGETVLIRNPHSVRPWQHVVSPLSGYLLLAQSLWADRTLATGWNFGPEDADARPVAWMVQALQERWAGKPQWRTDDGPHPHEARYLKLDSSRARVRLGWRPPVSLDDALTSIVEWYEAFEAGRDMRDVTMRQLADLSRGRQGETSSAT